ncbi:hypothetical protein F5Y05DRAFT_419225 [Hypoxylon sp. FL0543]|nr:hypothetical protein F5Y05DRAFT_419225 [Hypoxylon sp. FL0543]
MTKADISAKQRRARSVVENIAKNHGYLGEEVYAKMDAKTRRQMQEALCKKNEMIGASIISLVKNMRDGRFIFELLKNANDNSFTRAITLGKGAYVSFDIYKDRIIVECNEDGFDEASVQALCNVGQSTKAEAQGIGFKSVFRVAYQVHIQSGHYSFTLTHREEDSGMGMISPEWEETAQELPTPLTRMTLYIHGAGTENALRRRILRHFRKLDSSILLSLQSLEGVEIRFHDEDGDEASSSSLPMNHCDQDHDALILERIYTRDGDTTCTKQKDHGVPAAIREYRALLSQVAEQGRCSRVLQDPQIVQTDEDLLELKTFNEKDLFHDDLTQAERDKRVEAAGQLYVFELLSSLCFRFDHSDWTSTLRKYVTVHPDYEEIGSWTGSETSDFVYKDMGGVLTKVLVEKGFLQKKWRARRPWPKYYIKVKTTTGAWDEPFSIEGKAEYEKMKALSTDKSIYIIFRVFNLYSGEVDFKMYINPAVEESLEIVEDRWIVRPH